MDTEIRSILKQRAVAYDLCDGDLYLIQHTLWPTCNTDRDDVTVQDMLDDNAE